MIIFLSGIIVILKKIREYVSRPSQTTPDFGVRPSRQKTQGLSKALCFLLKSYYSIKYLFTKMMKPIYIY
jgi:hypothetical protein